MRSARTAVVRTATPADTDTLAWLALVGRAAYYRYEPGGIDSTPRPSRQDLEAWARRVVAPSPATVLVAELAGESVGTIAVSGTDSADVVELEQFWVVPHLWSHGIGGLLHEAAVERLRAAGVQRARTWVWDVNPRGHQFHTREGWVADGRRLPGPAGSSFVGMTLTVGPARP